MSSDNRKTVEMTLEKALYTLLFNEKKINLQTYNKILKSIEKNIKIA